jgi:hypothetical protein
MMGALLKYGTPLPVWNPVQATIRDCFFLVVNAVGSLDGRTRLIKIICHVARELGVDFVTEILEKVPPESHLRAPNITNKVLGLNDAVTQNLVVRTDNGKGPLGLIETPLLAPMVRDRYPQDIIDAVKRIADEDGHLKTSELVDREEAYWEIALSSRRSELGFPIELEDWRQLARFPPRLGGYSAQKRALVAITNLATLNGFATRPSVLCFGPPGVGKTTIARYVAYEMGTRGERASFLKVECQGLAASHGPEQIRQLLTRVVDYLINQSQILVLLLDEFDAIGSEKIDSLTPSELALRFWVMSLLGSRGKNVIILCSCNDPGLVDPAIRARISAGLIFFDLPLIHEMRAVLETVGFESHHAEKLSKLLEEKTRQTGLRLSVRNIQRGVEGARQDCKIEGIDFEGLPLDEKAHRIWIKGAPTYSENDYQKHRFRFDREIRQANENLEYLNELYDRLLRKDFDATRSKSA